MTCFAVVESFSQLCSRHNENSTGGTEKASLRLPPFVITQEDADAVIGINTFCDYRWKQGGPVEMHYIHCVYLARFLFFFINMATLGPKLSKPLYHWAE